MFRLQVTTKSVPRRIVVFACAVADCGELRPAVALLSFGFRAGVSFLESRNGV